MTYSSASRKTISGGLYKDLSSEDYHRSNGYSSSQIKEANKDIEYFYRKYVEFSVPKEESEAFDTGTAFHTAVLEPHKFNDEIVVYEGKRIGENWKAFQAHNPNKIIITTSQKTAVDNLVAAVNGSTVAKGLLKHTTPEVSAYLEIVVFGGEIFAPEYKTKLGKYGWEKADWMPGKKEGMAMTIKARADGISLNNGRRYVIDLKSMSGNAKDRYSIKSKISSLNYDLSAALYLDVFSAVLEQRYLDFFWIFASKDMSNSKTYLANSDSIRIGRAKWKKGILNIAEAISNDWIISDTIDVLEPNLWEFEHIKEQNTEELL